MGARDAACLVLGFLENILFSGVIFGWPNLVVVYKADELFCTVRNNDSVYGSQDLLNQPRVDLINTDTAYNLSGPVETPVTSLYNIDYDNVANTSAVQHLMTRVACTAKRDWHFALCYTLCCLAFQLASFPVGCLFDKYGFRITKISASFFFIAGNTLLGFASPGDLSFLVYPGMMILAISCCHIIIANQHLPALAGDRQATITTLYSGAIDSSIIVFLIVKLVYESTGISRRIIFAVYICLWVVLTSWNTFLLAPKFKVPPRTPAILAAERAPIKGDTDDVAFAPNITREAEEKSPSLEKELPAIEKSVEADHGPAELSFVGCLRTPLFWFHLYWFSVIQLRFFVYLGGLGLWLGMGAGGDDVRVSKYLTWFGYISLGGILSAPLAGVITDFGLKRGLGKGTNHKLLGKAVPLAPSLFVGCLLAILHSVAMLAWNDVVVYFTFVLLVLFRSFLFGNLYAYLGMVFPSKQFGKLYGVAMLLSGAISFFQFPLIIWAESIGSFFPISLLLLVLVCSTCVHPAFIGVAYRRSKRE